MISIFLLLPVLQLPVFSYAEPVVGRKAAEKYFPPTTVKREPSERGPTDNILMLHYGRFVQSTAYNWNDNGRFDDIGTSSYGLTYLADHWSGVDLNLRVDFNEYDFSGTKASKMSFIPLFTFPKAETRFPLYFGIGAGLGIFFQQISGKSNISMDYQLVIGARFLDLSPGVGFFVEYGMSNHIHILSQGQFNASKFILGPVFNF